MNDAEIRWRQFFDNFETVFSILKHYNAKDLNNDLEKGGFIHHFEIAVEHAYKVMQSFLEAKQIEIKNKREMIRQINNFDLIHNQRIWFRIDHRRKLVFYIHNKDLLEELISDIKDHYIEEIDFFYKEIKKLVWHLFFPKSTLKW